MNWKEIHNALILVITVVSLVALYAFASRNLLANNDGGRPDKIQYKR